MRTKNLITFAIGGILSVTAFAQQVSVEKDKKAIKDMCGCYEVTFKYTETFAPEIDYEKAHDYTAKALEWAEIIEEDEDKISLQHLLVINDTTVIKHWRQDWVYEDTNRYQFHDENQWMFVKSSEDEVKNQWTQHVYQVDDSPRYSGSATWIHADGRSYWNNKTDSPLPRREYSKRDDYNVMKRGNHVEITKDGWLHEQDNDKIIRKDGKEDVLLVQEKGYNVYTKVADEKCKVAQTWWKDNEDFWGKVRNKWTKVYGKNEDLKLEKAVNGSPLFMKLFQMDTETKKNKINKTIDEFVAEN